jgi:serine/threonine protein kinase
MMKDGIDIEIPHFEILRKIGNGANGTVYEARDMLLGRSVAIKIWNARGSAQAQSEAAKIAGLNHPLVVTTHAFGTVDKRPFAVMELVPGVSGKEWMRSAPDVKRRITVWGLFERALRHLHSVDIVHGDPHLGNIIVFEDEREVFGTRSLQGLPTREPIAGPCPAYKFSNE